MKTLGPALGCCLALAILGVAGCQKATEPSPAPARPDAGVELLSVPHPDLRGTDPGVQEQVREHRERVERPGGALDAEAAARAWGDLGLVYVLYDFIDAAEVCFENARRLEPNDFRWLYLLGYSHKLAGELDEAVTWLERSLEADPDSVAAMLRLGRAYFDLGDHRTARRWFERSLETRFSAAAAEGLGKIAAARGDHAEAVEHFTRALAEQPRANSLRYALGQSYRRLGRTEAAERELTASGDVAVSIPDPIVSPLATAGESAQFFLIQAGEAMDDQSYEAAVAAYERALEKEPSSFSTHRSLSYALQKLGDLDGAIRTLETGLERGTTGDPARDDGERAELYRILGGLEALGERDEAAIGHFHESLRLDSGQDGVRMKLANALARSGRFDEAVVEYTALLASSPDLAPDVLTRRATALVNLGRGEEAIADFERAVGERPDDRRLRSRYADALERLGRPEQAARERRLATRDTGVSALLDRATAALNRDQPEEALRHLSTAEALEPENPVVLYQRASVLGHLERCDEAVGAFRRVIDREPRHAGARQGEIVCLVLLARYGEARVRLNEALRIFSRDARLAHLQARLLATAPETRVRDGELALAVAQRLAANVDGLRIRETLALAHAENGELARAVELQRELIEEARRRGETELVADFGKKLERLERGEAWTARSPREILDVALR